MQSIESLLDAHGIPYLSTEHEGRHRIQMLGLNLISSLGAHHYKSNQSVPGKIISIIEWADGQEFPDVVIKYLKSLCNVQNWASSLTAQGNTDWRVFPALGIYTTESNPSLSIPIDYISDCIAIMVISEVPGTDDDAVNVNCGRMLDISLLLEQAMIRLGVQIE